MFVLIRVNKYSGSFSLVLPVATTYRRELHNALTVPCHLLQKITCDQGTHFIAKEEWQSNHC